MPSTSPPALDAVTVNYNGGPRIIKTVEALLGQQPPLRRIHVIDNASTDGSSDLLRRTFPQVLVHAMGRNAGLSAARNVGLGLTDAPYVLLIDNDLYVADDCVHRLLSAQHDTGAAVICPRIVLHPGDRVIQADGAEAHFVGTMSLRHGLAAVEDTLPGRDVVRGAIGGCLLLDRRKVLEAGGFDDTYFFYFEDLEFMLRMRSLGHEFVCEARATALHDRGEGTPGLSFRGHERYPPRRAYLTMRHRLLTMFIHYRLRTLLVLSPALAVYELATLVLAIPRGWSGPWIRAWGWQLANWRMIRQKRRAVQSRRVRPDRELLSGGPLPLAQGLLRSGFLRASVRLLSGSLNAYWRIARHGIG